MYYITCQGNVPKPASSPPTILLCAVCFEAVIPHSIENKKIKLKQINYLKKKMYYTFI